MPSSILPKKQISSIGKAKSMSAILALCLTCILGAEENKPTSAFKGDKEKLHIYILIGQSNMLGRAPITEKEKGVIKNCYLLNKEGKWEPAEGALARYSSISTGGGRLNPGHSFSKEMLKDQEDISLGLVVNPKGGTSITQWVKNSDYKKGLFYKEIIRRANIAQKSGVIKGILWHQGESDSKKKDKEYLSKLKKFISNLRADLKIPDLPFVAGQINNCPLINGQIDKLPKAMPFTGVASSKGLGMRDRWHFNYEAQLILGRRYAREMEKLLKSPSAK